MGAHHKKPRADNGRTPWSKTEDEKLRELHAEGKTPCVIAALIGRSDSSVYRRIEIVVATPKTKKRSCMCCHREFSSDGPHHRLCTTCRQKSYSPYAP